MAKHIRFLIITAVALFSGAAFGQTVPQSFVVEGRLYDSSGLPLNDGSVNIRLDIIDTDNSCLLYRELHSNVNVSATNPSAQGLFALPFGSPTSVEFAGAGVTAIFTTGNGISGNGCTASGSNRSLVIHVDTAGSGSYETLSPATRLLSVPTAMVAQKAADATNLGGVAAAQYLKANGELSQSNLQTIFGASGDTSKLRAVMDGTSTAYLKSSPSTQVSFNDQRLTNIAAPTMSTDATNKGYSDSYLGGKNLDLTGLGPAMGAGKTLLWDATAGKWVAGFADAEKLQGRFVANIAPSSNQILKWNGSAWTPAGDEGITSISGDLTASGSGAVIATLNAGAVTNPKIADGAISSRKIAASFAVNRIVMTDGTTGSDLTFATCQNVNEVLKWTASGWQCSSISSLAPVTSVAGKTGAISLNTNDVDGLRTAALRDVGTSAENVLALDANAKLPAVDASQLANVNAVKLQGQNIAATTPTTNYVLKWNGSLWIPAVDSDSGGDITQITAGTGATGGGTSGHVTLGVDVGTGANKIVQLDGSARLPAVDGGSLTNVNAQRLQAKTISTAAPSSGDVLRFNNSNSTWEPQAIPSSPVTSVAGRTGAVTLSVSDVYGSLTSITAGNSLLGGGSSGAVTLSVNVGTGANQVVQLDASARLPAIDGGQITNINAQRLQGRAVASTTPTLSQVLAWNGSQWEPTTTLASYPLAGSLGTASAPTYSFTGDSDTGWFSPGAGLLAASTNTTERLRLDSVGNIGIGTTAPNSNIHVHSPNNVALSLRMTNVNTGATSTDGSYLGIANTGNLYLWNHETSTLSLGTNNLERLVVDANGNVGINSATPAVRLDVNGVTNVKRIDSNQTDSALYTGASASANPDGALNYFTNTSSATGTASHINWQSGTTQRAYMGIVRAPSGNAPAIVIGQQTSTASTTERMRIDASGNVGIGTTSPTSLLDLFSSDTNGAFLEVATPGTQAAQEAGIRIVSKSDNGILGSSNSNAGWKISARGNNYSDSVQRNTLTFSSWDGTAWKQSLNLLTNGRLGVNTTNPGAALEVSPSSAGGTDGGIKLGQGIPTDKNMVLYNDSGNLFWNGVQVSLGGATISGTTNYIPKLTAANSVGNSSMIELNNKVGIGTSSPETTLHVAVVGGSTAGSSATVAQFEGVGLFRQNSTLSPVGLILTNLNGTDTGTAMDFRGNSGGTEKTLVRMAASQSAGNGKLTFHVNKAGTLTDPMILDTAGETGIGTTAMAALTVDGQMEAKNFEGPGVKTLLATVSNNTAGANLIFNGFSSRFRYYEVVFEDLVPSGFSGFFQVVLFSSSNWQYGNCTVTSHFSSGSTNYNGSSSSTGGFFLNKLSASTNGTLGGLNGSVQIINPAGTTSYKIMSSKAEWMDTSTFPDYPARDFRTAIYLSTAAVTGIGIVATYDGSQANALNFTGTIKVYGWN